MKTKFINVIFAAVYVLSALCVADAQQTGERKTQIPFPLLPFIAEYEYQPYFFAQWIAGHPQYSRVEAILDNLDKPASIKLVLIEKETGKRAFYCSSDAQAKTLQAEGKEVYATKIDFKTAQEAERQPTYGFGFRDKRGQAILWRVIPATRPSERGRQLIPAGASPGLPLDYRELGTAVGEGTAIQIGETVVEAEPWTEISAPPFFVAYRGTVAVGRHFGVLRTGAKKWNVITRPSELKAGAEWTLSDESGQWRSFKIAARNDGELIIEEQSANRTSTSFVVHTTDAREFVLRSVRLRGNSQTMQIRFDSELPLNSAFAGKFETTFAISLGKYDKIVGGAVSVERAGDNLRLRLIPKTPDWTRTRGFETIVKIEPDGYSIEATQPTKN